MKHTFIYNMKHKFIYILSFLFLVIGIIIFFFVISNKTNNNNNNNNNKIIKYTKHDSYIFNKIVDKYRMTDKIKIYQPFDNYPDDVPHILDLRSKCPEIYDQGKMGTCHVQAICFLYHYICKQLNIDFIPSRMFLEYTSHQFFNNISRFLNYDEQLKNYIFDDAGGNSSSDLFAIFIDGVCSESEYPYPSNELLIKYDKNINLIKNLHKNINNNNKLDTIRDISILYKDIKLVPPSKNNFKRGKLHRVLDSYQIDYKIIDIKKCLNYIGPISFSIKHAEFLLTSLNIYVYNPSIKSILLFNKILLDKYSKDKNLNILLIDFIKSIEELLNNFGSKDYKLQNKIQDDIKKYQIKINANEIYKNEFSDLIFVDKDIQDEIYNNLNFTEEELIIKFPTDIINDCIKIFNKYGIDLNEMIKYFEYSKNFNFNINLDELTGISDYKNIIKNDDFKYAKNYINELMNDNSGHMMAIVGYNDYKKYFIIRNSWGKISGKDGYFYIDYEYFTNKNYLFGCNICDLFSITKTTDGSISFVN